MSVTELISVSIFGLVALLSLDPTPKSMTLEYPDHWPAPIYDFSKNPLTDEGVDLGRMLFYDPILSADSSVSCSSCHLSYTAFTHVDHALSHGVDDRIGRRNSMTLVNLAWSSSFMWDGAINHLDMQALAPISDSTEMDSDIASVVSRLNGSKMYRERFAQAFGDESASGEYVLKALAQFQLTLISDNAKYDQVMAGVSGVHFTAQERKGREVFDLHCNSCHTAPLFTNGGFASNGVPIDPELVDSGRVSVSREASDVMKFKVPSLRNIEFSRPYMHDGRFDRLDEVMNHYTSAISALPNTSTDLVGGISLSADEQVDLTAFLLTLSDTSFLFSDKHSYPRQY